MIFVEVPGLCPYERMSFMTFICTNNYLVTHLLLKSYLRMYRKCCNIKSKMDLVNIFSAQ